MESELRFPRFRHAGLLALLVTLSPLHPFTPSLFAQPETTVGISGKIDSVVLPGPELRVKELRDRTSSVVVRIVRVYPHGTAFRYDLEYYGLVPGTHDLRESLERKDGSPTTNLPPLLVKVNPVLPPGQIEPNKLEIDRGLRLGGYRKLAIVIASLWVVILLILIGSFFFPRRKKVAVAGTRPVSLAERLRPLVEGAVAGKLSRVELANLERALLAYWRKRLGLEAVEPGEAVETLRRHPQAGPLLAELEAWLHRPGSPAPVDVGSLLAPYRDLPPDALNLPGDAT